MEMSQASTSQSKKYKYLDNYTKELIVQSKFNDGMSYKAIADKYKVSKSTVEGIIQHWIQYETVQAINHDGSRYQILTDTDDQLLKKWLEENLQLTLNEMKIKLQEEHEDEFDITLETISKHIYDNINFTLKMLREIPVGRNTQSTIQKRYDYAMKIRKTKISMMNDIIYLDETRFNLYLHRSKG